MVSQSAPGGPGNELVYHFRRPHELPPGHLDQLAHLVEIGGQVAPDLIRYHLENAFLIGYAMDGETIVGMEVMKTPRPEYLASVKERTGLDLTGYVERGYASVLPSHRRRGIMTVISRGLIEHTADRPTFMILASDNTPILKVGARNRVRLAVKYFSEAAGKEVGIYLQT